MRFVAIGGDAAGMSAASRAMRKVRDIQVTVFEQTRDVSYSACGMPYNIAEPDRPIDDLVVRPAHVFRDKLGIDLRLGHRVTAVDRSSRTVSGRTSDGQPFEAGYDKLLIATGASPKVPDLPGFDLPGVLVLKSLEHGRQIKQYLARHRVQDVTIVGMGYIALEMAEALRTRGIGVKMVKPRSALLPWMDSELSDMVHNELTAQGVELYPGHAIESIHQDSDRLKVVCRDMSLKSDAVLVAVGVTPNNELAAQAGLELGAEGAIAVDRSMRTSDADIYAAGDCADAFSVVTGQRTWVPLALRANRAGWAVADHLAGRDVDIQGVAGTAVFKVFDLEVASTGLNPHEAEEFGFSPQTATIEARNKAHGHPGSSNIKVHIIGDAESGRLLGAQMVGREGVAHRINAAAVALHAQMSVADFAQCDLAYAPPFGPVWDPLLTAANQLLKKL
jgi:NADPH-dependent 2,4-dienoyl-CoA reductase/sulfur reductase-like enzyme